MLRAAESGVRNALVLDETGLIIAEANSAGKLGNTAGAAKLIAKISNDAAALFPGCPAPCITVKSEDRYR